MNKTKGKFKVTTTVKISVEVFLLVSVFFALFSYGQESKPKDVRFYLQQAAKARKEKNYQAYLENLRELLVLRPSNSTYTYYFAAANALNGNSGEALALLGKIADMGLIFPADKEEDFASIKDSDAFKSILQKFAANKTPVGKSSKAFTLGQKDLIAEGVAYDPKTETFYVSSIHKRKIVSVDKTGAVRDFSAEQDGLWSVLGMKVDAKRRHLWVTTTAHAQMLNAKAEEIGISGIFKYDLSTGKLIKKYLLSNQPKARFLGDLVISKNGDVYATDSLNPNVYIIPRRKDEIELFLENESLVSPQGLDFSPDEKYLFIADYAKGLYSVDLKTKAVKSLTSPKTTTVGVDGLYFYKGDLIGVQNSTNPQRIIRMKLSSDFNSIENFETLEANNALFDEPTLGVVVKDTFFYIANSQWGAMDRNGLLTAPEKLREPLILKVKL